MGQAKQRKAEIEELKKNNKRTLSSLRPWDRSDDQYINDQIKNNTIHDHIENITFELNESMKIHLDVHQKGIDHGRDLTDLTCQAIRCSIRDIEHYVAAMKKHVEQCEINGVLI